MAGKPIRSRIGAFSSPGAIARVDQRSTEARHVRDTAAALTDQLGGPTRVTPAQRLLIESAAVINLRLKCVLATYETGEALPEHLDDRMLKLVSGLRKVLLSLGLEGVKTPALSLAEYLELKKSA